MKVLVTGAGGFLGQHLIPILLQNGHDVVCPTRADCDLRHPTSVRDLVRRIYPDAVIHLAATVGGIGYNEAHPAAFIYDNLAMGIHLLHESALAEVKKFVLIGTTCSYPRTPPLPFNEDSLWDGYPEPTNAPYGVAKRALMVQADAYRRQLGFNAISLVPTNLYGPGDHFALSTAHVIPATITRMAAAIDAGHEEIALWGDGTPTREFYYVADCARAIARAFDVYNDGQPLNLGTGVETAIADVVAMVGDAMGYRGRVRWDASRPNGQPRRCLDVSRAQAALGDISWTALQDGIQRTVAWHRSNVR
jgi:GDP-L-fucose synthase